MISREFLREADSFITKLSNPQDYQTLVDPQDVDHTARIVDVNTFDLQDPASKAQYTQLLKGGKSFKSSDVPQYTDDSSKRARVSYLYSITNIPLNNSEHRVGNKLQPYPYVHVIRVRVLKPGSQQRTPDRREIINYIWFSSEENINLIKLKISALPITPRNTGIGDATTSRRNHWYYLPSNRQNTKGQDELKPSAFLNLSKQDFSAKPVPPYGIGAENPPQSVELSQQELQAITQENTRLVAAIKKSGRIKLDTIEQLIRRQRGSTKTNTYIPKKKAKYLADLLAVFLKPNNARNIYPLKLTNSDMFSAINRAIGVQGANSITTDFMEVIHPIALLTGNCTGNARDMVLEHFGAKNWEDIARGAVITYPTVPNYPLVDSVVYYPQTGGRGFKRLGVSSKKGGQGSAFSSLALAWNEAQEMAGDSWRQVEQTISNRPEYWAAWTILRAGLSNDPQTMEDAYTEAAEWLEIPVGDDQKRRVIQTLNSTQAFSELVVWIFNHSATVQVDTYVTEGGGDQNKPTVLTNIVATWPTQLADSAAISDDGNKVKLLVNGRPVEWGTANVQDRNGSTRSGDDARRTKIGDYPGIKDSDIANSPILQQIRSSNLFGTTPSVPSAAQQRKTAAIAKLQTLGINRGDYERVARQEFTVYKRLKDLRDRGATLYPNQRQEYERAAGIIGLIKDAAA